MDVLHHVVNLYHSMSHLNHKIGDMTEERHATMTAFQRAGEAADFVRSSLPPELSKPRIAIVCGSGLGGLAQIINASPSKSWDYEEIPHFPVSTGRSRAVLQTEPRRC